MHRLQQRQRKEATTESVLPHIAEPKKQPKSFASRISSLCFNDAVILRRNNEITEDEYLQVIVGHCTGLRHGSNGACNNDTTEPGASDVELGENVKDDSFALAVASWIYRHFDQTPVEGKLPVFF